MNRYVLDTNLYIEAAREKKKAEELKSFFSAFLPFVFLHAVVVQELLAGAVTPRGKEQIEQSIVAPFERRGRLVIPSYRAWKRSGEIVAELVREKELSPGGFKRSFMNDALIAASLRENGMILITRNVEDFKLLSKVETFQFVESWPMPL